MTHAASENIERPGGRRPGRPRHTTPSPGYRRRREEIVDAAVPVFQTKGYDAGTLDDVAAALDLRKASLYYYVQSKAELLYLVFDRAISSTLRDLEQTATSGSSAQRVANLVRRQIQTVASNPSLFAVFFDQRPHLDSDYEGSIHAKERRYLQVFTDAVAAAIEDNLIAAQEPRHVAQLLLGMANWTYKWIHPDEDINAVAEAATQLVLGPIRIHDQENQPG